MSLCFGVKIILVDKASPVSQDTSFGLYNVAGENSEFRWSQNDISGLSTAWCSGMIVKNGLKRFTKQIDLSVGGNISYPGKGQVSVKNINKFWEECQSRGITFNGLKLEIWELGTGDHQHKIRTYFCTEPKWNNEKFSIPFKGGQEKRVANIINVVNSIQFPNASNDTINKSIPATFGKLTPVIDASLNKMTRSSIAQLIRTDDAMLLKKYTDDFFTSSGYESTFQFPVESINDPAVRWYTCALQSDSGAGIVYYSTDNVYVKIVDGTGSNQIRKINVLFTVNYDLVFKVDDFFETELNDDGTGEGRSWVQFIKINRVYDVDHFPCKGFCDYNSLLLDNGAEIYTFTDEDGIQRIAPYGYDFVNTGRPKNRVGINPIMYDQGDLDTQNSFLILPVENFRAANDDGEANLGVWNSDSEGWWDSVIPYSINYPSLYTDDIDDLDRVTISNWNLSNLSNVSDKDKSSSATSYYEADVHAGGGVFYKVFYFDLPALPPGFTFETCYLCIKFTSQCGDVGYGSPKVRLRRFKYTVNISNFGVDENDDTLININDVPDFYCVDTSETNNQQFFQVVDDTYNKTGYTNSVFELDISSREEYETLLQGSLIFDRVYLVQSEPPGQQWTDVTEIYEIAIMFKKSSDIKENIFSSVQGRIFSYTWQGRKTASNLMTKPNDILEHICRLQNYSDVEDVPAYSGWGLQYANEPLIGVNDWGSFDDPDLLTARDYDLAGQIYEFDDGYTDKIKKKICREIVLANWQDRNDYERVIALPDTKLDPVHTIQMSDILDRTKIEVMEFPESKIICEPWVNYNKNPATKEYENSLRITNTSASTFTTSFASGFLNDSDAQLLWNGCHSLYLRSGKVNKPTKDQTDLQFANGDGAYTIAYNYLKKWVDWQFTDEIKLPVHYNLAASWEECTPINLLFSHQTNNISRSALIESTSVNPNPPYDILLRAVMYA